MDHPDMLNMDHPDATTSSKSPFGSVKVLKEIKP